MANTVTIEIKGFIPDSWIASPIHLPDGLGRSFKGDNRGFSKTSNAYRLRQTITANFVSRTLSYSEDVGSTTMRTIYPDGTYVDETKTASTSGLYFTGVSWGTNYVQFTAVADVGNPFFTDFGILNYEIDYSIVFRVYDNGTVSLSGAHDGYPNYEIYRQIDSNPKTDIYLYDHKAHGKNIWHLTGELDVNVNLIVF